VTPTSSTSGEDDLGDAVRRRRLHSDEDILRAVRELLLEGGPRSVTTAAVSQRSGAPTGSLYHRFGSRSMMVAELWVRTIRRFHELVFAATSEADPGRPRALALARAVVDFAARYPDDARLLLVASREELGRDPDLPPELAAELRTLNAPVAELARQLCRELYGRVSSNGVERVLLAVVGLPYTAVRGRLLADRDPSGVWPLVEQGAVAILDADRRPASANLAP
jgi:AcrR family transcriptional regulator